MHSSNDGQPASLAFQREDRERQFHRELRLQQISRAAGTAGGSGTDASKAVAGRGKSARRTAAEPTTAKSKRGSRKKEAASPRMLFDAAGTLHLLVGISENIAARKANDPKATAAAAAGAAYAGGLDREGSSENTSASVLAALDAAREQLSSQLTDRATRLQRNGEATYEEKLPETPAELEQELSWLRRKTEQSRAEARREEEALCERFVARGRTIRAEEYASDERVMAARRKHDRYSRRQVALQRLKKPGSKLGPPLMDLDGEAEMATGGVASVRVEAAASSASAAALTPGGRASGRAGGRAVRGRGFGCCVRSRAVYEWGGPHEAAAWQAAW
jgi:hypothetical protein